MIINKKKGHNRERKKLIFYFLLFQQSKPTVQQPLEMDDGHRERRVALVEIVKWNCTFSFYNFRKKKDKIGPSLPV